MNRTCNKMNLIVTNVLSGMYTHPNSVPTVMKILLLTSIILVQTTPVSPELVKVSIYYEAHCPDSVKFINNQFYPAYQKIKSLLTVDFVPYGRAAHTWKQGDWHFECQHGPDECFGNKIHACGIDEEREQDQTVDYINCLLKAYRSSATHALDMCVPYLNVTSERILQCVKGLRGSNLLANYGNKTRVLYPLDFIPTIIFDNKFSSFVQSASLYNFHDAVIKYLADSKLSDESNDAVQHVPYLFISCIIFTLTLFIQC